MTRALLEVVQPLVCEGLTFRALEEQLLEITNELILRSLLASERLAAFWALFAQRHRADCANAA